MNGGGTRNLQKVVTHLGELGHQVRVLSPRREDSDQTFRWHPNVTVEPCLTFKQPFPGPYEISYHHMAMNVQRLREALADSDRFYLHDGEWLCHGVYADTPTVVSLRDNVYPESMLGAFNFQSDTLIAISQYSYDLYLATVGRSNSTLPSRLRKISNGIDTDVFCRREPSAELLRYLDFDPTGKRVILHPHRPESSKGMWQTVDVAERLVDRGLRDLLVLVPTWFDVSISQEVDAFYQEVRTAIAERGLEKNFHFHGWIPQPLMAEYYSLGELTLALGHFVEAFGNVPYESMACGTPAVVARVATHRSLMPDALIAKVHYDDAEAAAEFAWDILSNRRETSDDALAFIADEFSVDKQLAGYADAIINAELAQPEPLPPASPITEDTSFRLAPWCYRSSETRFYHDFNARHDDIPALASALVDDRVTRSRARQLALSPNTLESWYEAGFIIPASAENTN
ncbi:MAG: glycosyltransferase family 4 protein [Pseudomonadota bacterium]